MLGYIIEESPIELPDTEKTLQIVCNRIFSEIKRLQRHPELFPSQKVRTKFGEWVDCERKLYDVAVTSHENQLKMLASHLEGQEKKNEQSYRPFFKPTVKPWHQFLHNGAPGVTAETSKPKFGSFQLVPPGGVHLTGVWRCENKVMMKKRNVVSIVVLPHKMVHLTASLLLTAILPDPREASKAVGSV